MRKRLDALLTCVVTSLTLNALAHCVLSPLKMHPYFIVYVCGTRACISLAWVGLYQWITGESGLDPFINVAVTFLAPILAERWWWG